MNLDPAERAYLLDMRMLTTDAQGREVFSGLTIAESEEFFALSRLDGRSRRVGETWQEHDARQSRYLGLHNKIELAKHQIVAAEHIARTEKPSLN